MWGGLSVGDRWRCFEKKRKEAALNVSVGEYCDAGLFTGGREGGEMSLRSVHVFVERLMLLLLSAEGFAVSRVVIHSCQCLVSVSKSTSKQSRSIPTSSR